MVTKKKGKEKHGLFSDLLTWLQAGEKRDNHAGKELPSRKGRDKSIVFFSSGGGKRGPPRAGGKKEAFKTEKRNDRLLFRTEGKGKKGCRNPYPAGGKGKKKSLSGSPQIEGRGREERIDELKLHERGEERVCRKKAFL